MSGIINQEGNRSGVIGNARNMARNEGLHLRVVNTNTFDFDADKLTLFNTVGHGVVLDSFYEEINMTTSGIGGLDTGSQANAWYHVWAVYNGSTTGGVCSLSATAPTMPSGGYTYKKYIGAVYNDGSLNLQYIKQYGNVVGRGTVIDLSGGSATGWTNLSLSVPTTATIVLFYAHTTWPGSSTGWISYFSSGQVGGSPVNELKMRLALAGNMGDFDVGFRMPIITPQIMQYKGSSASLDTYVYTTGWEYPNVV